MQEGLLGRDSFIPTADDLPAVGRAGEVGAAGGEEVNKEGPGFALIVALELGANWAKSRKALSSEVIGGLMVDGQHAPTGGAWQAGARRAWRFHGGCF